MHYRRDMNRTMLDQKLTKTVRMLLSVRQENQTDLVDVLGLGWPAVNNRFRGKQGWKVRELEALADHFGVQPADLLQGDEHAVISVMGIRSPRQREAV